MKKIMLVGVGIAGEPVTHLAIGIFGKTDATRLSDTFEARSDIDAITHQVAVALLHDIAEMDTDAKLDTTLRWKTRVALDHAVLHLDGAADGIDHAAKLDDDAVASAFNDPA
jgi:hypothetical protein